MKTQKVKRTSFKTAIVYIRSTSRDCLMARQTKETKKERRRVMNNMEILADAFEFIEGNLQNEIKTQDVADACFCSKSALEKIFRCISGMGVHQYVIKRRMMLAARMIVMDENYSLLDVALSCGYSTNESFTRAFKSVWNCNPSEFKGNGRYFELFPRLYPPLNDGDDYMNTRRHVDISEMYDLFVQRKNCYFVCADINSLVPINEISFKAGDLAILETMNRMQKEAGDEDIVFRIGGDEFVMLTASEDIRYAEDVCERIKKYNGETFRFEEKVIPLKLHTAIVKFEGSNLRYRDLYETLHVAIMENKN